MFVRKAALVCDKCGDMKEVSTDFDPALFPSSFRDDDLAGWIGTGENNHLCPVCAKVYKEREAEMRRELDELAGKRSITFDI